MSTFEIDEGKALIERKHKELTNFLRGRAYGWRADPSRIDDIVSSTMMRLLVENETKKPFSDARMLWGRATNLVKEEIAQTFADRLPLSGVKFQAHRTATLALQRAGGDPRSAYGLQTGTSRVGRELLYAVAYGPSLFSPEYLQDVDMMMPGDEASLSELTLQEEDSIRAAMASLDWFEKQVVHLRMWMQLSNAQAAEELHVNSEKVRKTWSKAIKKLKPLLEVALSDKFGTGNVE